MDNMLETALELHPARLHLLVAPSPIVDRLADACIARLALDGPLSVLDGGNRFAAHQIARYVRRGSVDLEHVLGRIQVARAFTCYQMAAALTGLPGGERPVLVLRLLTTFHDENVPRGERLRLLQVCLAQLTRLSRRAPLLVSAAPGALVERLEAAAGQVWRYELPAAAAQPRLL